MQKHNILILNYYTVVVDFKKSHLKINNDSYSMYIPPNAYCCHAKMLIILLQKSNI